MTKSHFADLKVGFGGLKFIPMPFFVFSHNSLAPRLILHEHHVEYKGGFFTKYLAYEDIEKVDVYFSMSSNCIVLYKKKGISTFVGSFVRKTQLEEFLKLFHTKGCDLSETAKKNLTNR